MVKYLTNIFLATKVAFANEMKIACDAIGIDYKKVIEYSLHDHRLGQSHWDVPGPDGKLGFGGSCFPKDINALIHFFDRHGLDNKLLKSVWETNLKVRPERDWEKLKGRAIVDED
jgi:UDPglucose 6-dehydrogenase